MRMYYIYIVYDVSYFLILGLIEILNLCTLISGNAFISHFVLAGFPAIYCSTSYNLEITV